MLSLKYTFVLLLLLLLTPASRADTLTIAAASDLRFAMDEVIAAFRQANPSPQVQVVYGSSGKFHAQIRQSAPYDLYFSADIAYPRVLASEGFAASPVTPYARGRIVLWSPVLDASALTLDDLAADHITRIAIANPKHAPYGQRAEQALRSAGLWEQLEPRLVYGENIAHTAQFVQSGNAQVGIIALALALHPQLAGQGGYHLLPEHLHSPLEQGFMITRHGKNNPLARRFAEFMDTSTAQSIMRRYGFALPITSSNSKNNNNTHQSPH